MPKYRLLARAEMQGSVREPGFVFELEEGKLGPHKTVVASNHGAQIADHISDNSQNLKDVPLYELIEEEIKEEAAEQSQETKSETAEVETSGSNPQ